MTATTLAEEERGRRRSGCGGRASRSPPPTTGHGAGFAVADTPPEYRGIVDVVLAPSRPPLRGSLRSALTG
ncbi:MAG TPA: hypothetical protein VF526_04685 [Solirubrobacteraceae bacterium]